MIPLVISGAVMWLVAHLIAPFGYQVSFWRAILSIFCISVISLGTQTLLYPTIGILYVLPALAICALVVSAVLRLPFGRSALAVFVYLVVQTGLLIFYGTVALGRFS